jgi:hypothetical protein
MSHFSIFIHEYIQFPTYLASYIFSLYPPQSPRQDLFSVFEKRHFCLYKIAIQGVSL